MKIYVITSDVDYACNNPVEAYTNKEKADQRVKEFEAKDWEDRSKSIWCPDGYSVHEIELKD